MYIIWKSHFLTKTIKNNLECLPSCTFDVTQTPVSGGQDTEVILQHSLLGRGLCTNHNGVGLLRNAPWFPQSSNFNHSHTLRHETQQEFPLASPQCQAGKWAAPEAEHQLRRPYGTENWVCGMLTTESRREMQQLLLKHCKNGEWETKCISQLQKQLQDTLLSGGSFLTI